MLSWRSFPTLYNMALRSLIEWTQFDVQLLEGLPGFLKDDLLKVAVLRGKFQEHISYFLHPLVRKLDISECKITPKELENISQCLHIRVLEMNPPKYHRYNHPSCALERLFSQLHHLLKLHIQRNDGMTDNVMSVLTSHCPFIQELDVSGCTNLTDESIKFVSSLSYIRSMNLSDTLISDISLTSMSKGNSSNFLCELKLNNCVHISDMGINALIKGCKNLSILVFCGCPKVSVDCQLDLDSFMSKGRKSKLVTWTVYF